MIPIDTSVIYALLDRADARHARAVAWYRREQPAVATTPLVLAARLESTAIATFDERRFRAVRPLTGETAFRLLPLDADDN